MLLAKERGLTVDEVGFSSALNAQQQRSKQAAVVEQGDWITVMENAATSFVGYDQLEATARIVKYRTVITRGQQVYQVVLNQTPFYPEGGGQVGDVGHFVAREETIVVLDTQKENDLIIHYVERLPLVVTASLQAVVNQERRVLTASNHTATHLLHASLRQVLGPHIEQRGSLVNAQLLRFDFSHPTKLSSQEITQIEGIVNQKIRDNIVLTEQRHMPLAVAQDMGAAAFFGEKYGEQVRVIIFDPAFSMELCGGTHVSATGQLGFFKITASVAVAAGVRRIEAVTAVAAEQFIQDQVTLLGTLQALLKNPKDPTKEVQKLLQEKAAFSKKVAIYEAIQVQTVTDQLRNNLQTIHGVYTMITQVELPQVVSLKQVALALQKVGKPCFVVLTTILEQKPHIAVALSEGLAQRWQQNAQDIARKLAQPIQGGGGGTPTFATAGGIEVNGLPQVLQMARELLEQNMTK